MVSAYLADVDFPPDARVLEDRPGARGRDERGGAPDRAKTRPVLRRSGPSWVERAKGIEPSPRAWEALSVCLSTSGDAGRGLRWLTAADRWRPLWTAGWGTSGSTGRRSSPPGCATAGRAGPMGR
jgi:hypothetical protein